MSLLENKNTNFAMHQQAAPSSFEISSETIGDPEIVKAFH